MTKKYLLSLSIIAALALTAGVANAYPQTMFGTGYGFNSTSNMSNGVNYSNAINKTAEQFDKETSRTYAETEKNISNIIINEHDEAANAGYKTNYTPIPKDGSDYNPYTGASSGVNDTKSIYTDDLGRLHFFGKGNRFRTQD